MNGYHPRSISRNTNVSRTYLPKIRRYLPRYVRYLRVEVGEGHGKVRSCQAFRRRLRASPHPPHLPGAEARAAVCGRAGVSIIRRVRRLGDIKIHTMQPGSARHRPSRCGGGGNGSWLARRRRAEAHPLPLLGHGRGPPRLRPRTPRRAAGSVPRGDRVRHGRCFCGGRALAILRVPQDLHAARGGTLALELVASTSVRLRSASPSTTGSWASSTPV